MSQPFEIKRGDREPAITRQLMQSGAPIDLTGASVKFLMRGDDGLKVDAAADIDDDPTTGIVTYEWAAADVDTAGVYKAEWEVTRAGRTLTVPTNDYIKVTVVADLDGGPVIESDPPAIDGGDILVGGAGSSGVIEIAADDTVEFALSSLNTETQNALDDRAAASHTHSSADVTHAVNDRTADINLTGAHVGQIFTNTSASGQVQCNLPASPAFGDSYTFIANNGGAFNFVINCAGSQRIKIGNTPSSAGGAAYWTGAIGAVMTLTYIATDIWQYTSGASTLPNLA